jgi:hypothetical protein
MNANFVEIVSEHLQKDIVQVVVTSTRAIEQIARSAEQN